MRIVSTFHPSSSVTSSLRCCLVANSATEHLVVAKPGKIEVFVITDDGLKPDCEVEIWGVIVSIKAIPAKRSAKHSNLLVLTDHPDSRLIVLTYSVDNGSPSLVSKPDTTISLLDRNARHAEFFHDIVVDTSGRIAVINSYVGKLKVLMFDRGIVSDHFDVSIPELNLLSLSFLPTAANEYTLAIVHVDYQQRLQLLGRDLHLSSQELSPEPSSILTPTILSSHMFPSATAPLTTITIEPFSTSEGEEDEDEDSTCPGGVLILGGRSIAFYTLASEDSMRRRKDKQRRLEKRKANADEDVVAKALVKEKERGSRRTKPSASLKWPWSEVTASCWVDFDSRKLILGDSFGRMSMLILEQSNSLILLPLGQISPPTTLTYITPQMVFIGSHLGDSQLVRIHPGPVSGPESDTLPISNDIQTVDPSSLAELEDDDEEMEDLQSKEVRKSKGTIIKAKGSHVEVLETYQNIAPIMDATLADLDGSGQPHIVTCSGGGNSGSLNIIRTGADFNEIAVLNGILDAQKVFPIRPRYHASTDSHLLVSTSKETHLLRFDGHLVTHVESSSAGFDTSAPTLAACNITRRVRTASGGKTTTTYQDSPLVVQVTSRGVFLYEYDEVVNVFHPVGRGWLPDQLDATWRGRVIVAASVNASQVVLGLSRGRLALLSLGENSEFELKRHRDFAGNLDQPQEICAISCAPFDTTKHFASHIAVAFWDYKLITILSLESAGSFLSTVCESNELPDAPRSVLLHNFGEGRKAKDPNFLPHILVGLRDGSVMSFRLVDNTLQDKRIFALGTNPVETLSTMSDEKRSVFGCGSRCAVFYWAQQRLKQSSIAVKGVVYGMNVNTSGFPSSLLLCTADSLIIGDIRGMDKMQIRSIPLGLANPRRVTYHSTHRMFALASSLLTPHRVGDAPNSRSSLSIVDGHNSTHKVVFTCEAEEEISAIHCLSASQFSNDDSTMLLPSFAVGTVRHELAQREPSEGRLLLFSLDPVHDRSSSVDSARFKILAETKTPGCVYALDSVGDLLVAAVNSSVILYRMQQSEMSSETDLMTFSLTEVLQWNHNYFVTSLVVRDQTILIADAISSVSLLKLQADKITVIAKDYGPLWPVTVDFLSDGGIVGANCDTNLFTFSVEGLNRLERNGSFYLGDGVNKILSGSVNTHDPQDRSAVNPEHLFFTSSGRIGLLVNVKEKVSLNLTALQRNMAKKIKGVGGIDHTKYRAPATPRGRSEAEAASFGFLDGDFLEQFLSHPKPSELIRGDIEAERVDSSHAELQGLLEKLQSLH